MYTNENKIQYPIIFKHLCTENRYSEFPRYKKRPGRTKALIGSFWTRWIVRRERNAGGKTDGAEELAGERTKDGAENNRAACLRGRKEGREIVRVLISLNITTRDPLSCLESVKARFSRIAFVSLKFSRVVAFESPLVENAVAINPAVS